MAKVLMEKLNKHYGEVKAVRDFDLEIADKEFVVLVGPSGCGKTTTLRMVAGLEDITAGNIYIDDKVVNNLPPKDRDIAMVFQNYALYPHMTVYQNMAFGLTLRKFPKEEINQRVKDAAEVLNIGELLQRKPKALSGGQRQRVAVGRAIVRKPKVFLFDEPLSNLDAKLRVQMRAELSALHHRLQATMIYVTHDQVEAMTMGDRIVVLKDGLIQQIGTPLGLYNTPVNRFVAGFIGSPPMNFMKVSLRDQGGKLMADEGSFQLELTPQMAEALRSYVGKEVILGVRPEDLLYAETAQPHNNIVTKVEVVEPLGAEIHLWVSTKANQIVARVAPRYTFHVGDAAHLHPDLAKVHFFDLETEKAIL